MPTPVSTPPIIRLGLSMSSFLLLLVAVPSFPHVHAENQKTIEGYLGMVSWLGTYGMCFKFMKIFYDLSYALFFYQHKIQ